MEVIDKDGSVIAQIGQGGLTVTPHPLTLDGQRHIPSDLIPGESLASFLRRHVDNIDSGTWIVSVNGYEVPQAMWTKTRPKHGTLIECRSVVRKGAIQLAAIIALTIYAPQLGMALAAATTMTTAAIAYTAAITVAGSMIINKVLGPKQAGGQRDSQASPTYALSGGRNRARQYEPIGLLFGELRVTPDYASVPYTWFAGEDQYLHAVFHGGINCGSVSSLRIGKTPIENYAGVETRTSGFSAMAEQGLDGWPNVDSIAGGQLTEGLYVTRTSSASATGLQIDLEGSLFSAGKNGPSLRHCGLTAEYRALPSGSWAAFLGSGADFTVENSTSKPLRLSYVRSVALGQYEVRIRKNSPDENGNPHMDLFTWTQLKTIQLDSGTYGGMSRLGIKIKASGQLNGSLDELNWIATAKGMPYWNGSTWTTATTRANGLSNPGAQMLLFARGIKDGSGNTIAGLGFADSRIDIESLQGFMAHCAAKGFTFDFYLDSPMSCQEILDAMALAGMGSISWQSGKLGVVWAAADQPISGVVNMATMKAKSFSVNYSLIETADGIEYNYFDRDRGFEWRPIRVAAPGVTTVLNPHRITAIGVTTEAHAAVMARFHMAQSVYQRKDISFEADLEHLTYGRMSVMALSHDVTQWGYGGRLHSVVNNAGILTLELDDVVPAGSGARYIGLRVPGEKGYRIFGVNSFSGSSRTLTLSTAWPTGIGASAVPGSSAGNPAHDTIWIYDFRSTPGYKVRVAAIQPQSNLAGATVAVVPESPEFWDYVLNGDYTPPPNQSLLQAGVPTVSRLSVTEELKRQGQTFYVELTAAFDAIGPYDHAEVWGALGDDDLKRLPGEARGLNFDWRGSIDDVWTIEVRPFSALGRAGDPVSTTYTVAGLKALPETVTGVALTQEQVFFDEVGDADLRGYEVRAIPGTEAKWSMGVAIHRGVVTDSPYRFPTRLQGIQTIMVAAVDTSDNYGLPGYATLDFGVIDELNIAQTHDFKALGWIGEITNGTASGGDLVADLNPAADFWAIGADFWVRDGAADFWGGSDYLTMDYIGVYVPAYSDGDIVLDTTILGSRAEIKWRVDGGTLGEFWTQGAADFWSGYASFWGDIGAWQPYVGAIKSSKYRGIQFWIRVDAGPQQGQLTQMAVRLQMPTKSQVFTGLAISSSGTRLDPALGSPPVDWIQVEQIDWTIYADGSGAVAGRTKDFNPDLGPLTETVNSSGIAVNSAGQAARVSGF